MVYFIHKVKATQETTINATYKVWVIVTTGPILGTLIESVTLIRPTQNDLARFLFADAHDCDSYQTKFEQSVDGEWMQLSADIDGDVIQVTAQLRKVG